MNTNQKSVQLNKEYNPEVRLKDVFFHILYHWRSLLLIAVLCAAAFGGWQYFRVNAVHQAGNLTKEEQRYERDLEDYQNSLEKAQKNLKKWQRLLKERYTYRDHSLLMNLDPENTWAAEKKYLICSEVKSPADVLIIYAGAMENGHDESELENAFGTSNAGYVDEIATIRTDAEEKTFCATVYASDKETAEKGLAYMIRKIEEVEKRAQGVEPHRLQLVSEGISRQIIADLSDKKYALNADVIQFESKLKTVERGLFNAEESEPLPPGDPVKRWAAAGAVLGLLGMTGIYLTAFAQRGKLRNGSDISEQYGVPLLGETNRSSARRPGKGLDGLLEKFEFRKNPKTEDQVYDNAAVLVQRTRKEGTLLLTGTVREEVLAGVQEALQKRLGEDVRIEIQADFPEDGKSAESVYQAGSVLWVEEKHVSRSEKIKRAAEVLQTSRAKIIGALIV